MWFSATLVLAFSLAATYAADDCSLSPKMDGIPAQRLAYALQNVTCPVNLGYTALYYHDNTSAVLPASQDIVTTIKETMVYLNATGDITSSAQTDLWRGPINDVPGQFSQWVGELLGHKKGLAKMADDVSKGLSQQRAAAKDFFDLVLAKVDKEQHDDVNGLLLPVLDELDCAVKAFKSGSSATACPLTSTAAGPTATGSGSGSKTTTASGDGAASGTTTAAAASSTDDDSAAGVVGHSLGRVLAGAFVACVAVPLM